MRTVPAFLAACLIALAALPARAAEAGPVPDLGTRKSGVDWPSFLGPAGTSTSPEKGITPWPRTGPRIVWHLPLGTGYGSPTIARGRLFLFDREGGQARLRCLRAETGDLLWTFGYPTAYVDSYGYANGPRCCPLIDEDRLYLHGVEGMLHCLSVLDGKVVWKVDTREDFHFRQNFFGVGSTPIIDGDQLLVQVGGSPKDQMEAPIGEVRPDGSSLVAFDKRTGKVRWRAGDELASYSSPVLATVHGQRRCLVLARGGLLALEPATGKVDFHFPWRARVLESVNAANPVVVGDQVLISETYGPGSALLTLKPDGPEVVWADSDKERRKNLQCHWNTPIHHDGCLYGCSGRHTNEAELRCLDWATGKVRWKERGLTRTTLLMVDGHFICLGEDGVLRLLKVNPDRYEELAQCELVGKSDGGSDIALLEYPCWAAPVLSHGLLYLRGKDRLVCVEVIPEPKP